MSLIKLSRAIPGTVLLCLFSSCGNSIYESQIEADSAMIEIERSPSYAYSPFKLPVLDEKMLAKKASLNIKVKNILASNREISQATTSLGGEVWNSRLKSEVQSTFRKKVSADSLLDVTLYLQTNEMTLRVPTHHLDSLLHTILSNSVMINDVCINTENVGLEYLSNELKSRNIARTQPAFKESGGNKDTPILDLVEAEKHSIEMQNEVVDKQIQNLALLDKVAYSTITILLSQDCAVYQALVANNSTERFDPPFSSSIGMAFSEGFSFVQSAIVYLVKIWPLYLILGIVYFLIQVGEKIRYKFF